MLAEELRQYEERLRQAPRLSDPKAISANQHGVYAIFESDDTTISYVGKSISSVRGRIRQHTRMHKVVSTFSFIEIDRQILLAVEGGLIHLLKPKFNKVGNPDCLVKPKGPKLRKTVAPWTTQCEPTIFQTVFETRMNEIEVDPQLKGKVAKIGECGMFCWDFSKQSISAEDRDRFLNCIDAFRDFMGSCFDEVIEQCDPTDRAPLLLAA